MAFDVVETEGKLNVPTALISYERKKGGKTAQQHRRPMLMVTIPTTICGAAKEKTHEFCVGTGSDAGKARVRPSKSAKAVKPTEFKNAFTWRFGYVPRLGTDAAAGDRVLVRKINDDEFEIDLPPWFALSKK